jgi:glutamyl-tRNA reductase
MVFGVACSDSREEMRDQKHVAELAVSATCRRHEIFLECDAARQGEETIERSLTAGRDLKLRTLGVTYAPAAASRSVVADQIPHKWRSLIRLHFV